MWEALNKRAEMKKTPLISSMVATVTPLSGAGRM
jgi:hypothetical protein